MIRSRNRTISISAKPWHNWKVFARYQQTPGLIMTINCTDLSCLLVVLVEEVVSPVLDAGLYVSAPGRPAHCPAPEVAGGGQGQWGHSSIEPRHGQTHLTAEHQTPGQRNGGSTGKCNHVNLLGLKKFVYSPITGHSGHCPGSDW